MNQVQTLAADPALRRRNRIAAFVIVAVAVAAMTWGTLYLRHYGFSTPDNQSQQQYH